MELNPIECWEYSKHIYPLDNRHNFLSLSSFLKLLKHFKDRAKLSVIIYFRSRKLNDTNLNGRLNVIENRLNLDKRIAGFFVWPYINKDFEFIKIFSYIASNYNIIDLHYKWMDLSDYEQIVILDLCEYLTGLTVVIEKSPWCIREGAVNFSLFLDGDRIMTMSFSFGECNNEKCVFVGSIQGANIPAVIALYKRVAAAVNDLRPRDLLLKVFRLFVQCIGIDKILAVSDQCRVQHHAFFGDEKSKQLMMQYDGTWIEHGGELLPSGFYCISSKMEERPISEVPTKKRGRYKRRLEMFCEIEQRLRGKINQLSLSQVSDFACPSE